MRCPKPSPYEPDGFIGVDLGIVNIATTSTGYQAAGRGLNRYRKRQLALRAKLQKKGTKSAKRLLKKRRRKEARHAKNINHIISKTIVTEAERTGRGIALEDLTGIRDRVRLRKPQRVALHSWAFAQLADFIVYKARRAGVPVVFVDPAYTSRQCAECGHIDRLNRVSQALFTCRGCGVVAHADRNASRVLAQEARTRGMRGGVTRPGHQPPKADGQDAADHLTASETLAARSVFRTEKLTRRLCCCRGGCPRTCSGRRAGTPCCRSPAGRCRRTR